MPTWTDSELTDQSYYGKCQVDITIINYGSMRLPKQSDIYLANNFIIFGSETKSFTSS
jgi:hypothetical protein